MPLTTSEPADVQLADEVAACYADPLRFVLTMYDWPINGEPGPDRWQREFLKWVGQEVKARRFNGVDPVAPIRGGVSSGHGIGKGALTAWLVDWIMSTRPHCKGTITANTNEQLEKKTWSAIRWWTAQCLTAHWFEVTSEMMYRIGHRESWFVSPQSCAEEKSEAFAGQHAKDSTSFYIFDEASAVPDVIWQVAEGGLTDGEPHIYAFGNPTRNTGAFHRIAFGSQRERWNMRVIDARECRLTNKAQIAEWIEDYSEDSDFVRVRVRGLPPNADELQLIPASLVYAAQSRVPQLLPDEPLVCGVDVSGGGSAWTICAFRQGNDARAIPWMALTGEQTVAHERQLVIAKLAQMLNDYPVTAMFIDAAFGAVIVQRLRDMGYRNVHEVNFGGPSADPYCENARAAMWKQTKTWLEKGAISPQDHRLATDLTSPGFHLNKKNKLVIESKESMQRRGVASIDRADALALTFSMPVKAPARRQQRWGAVAQSPFA